MIRCNVDVPTGDDSDAPVGCQIYLNGFPIEGPVRFTLSGESGGKPTIHLEMVADKLELEMSGSATKA